MPNMSLADFVAMTTKLLPENRSDFLPTLVDPIAREIRALDDIPEQVDLASTVRNWGEQSGIDHYFIAYPVGDSIIAEEYRKSEQIGSQIIN